MSDIKLTKKQDAKIRRAVKALNDVREELQEENPESSMNWHLEDSNNLNLMQGDSHDMKTGERQRDNVIKCYDLWHSSGGGW